MKYLKWMLKSILFGIVALFIFNFIGQYFNLNIPVNVFTILIIGTLKIPGLVALLLFNLW
jgi:inhibitor of the pro-sigma K processing machinery